MTELQAIKNVRAGSTDFGDGIAVSASADNLVRNNVVRGNGPFSGIRLEPFTSENVVTNNRVHGNGLDGFDVIAR